MADNRAHGDERLDPPRLVDLTHVVESGMVTYSGLPAPEITDHLSWEDSHALYAPGTEFTIARISMVANTGTYLDAPSHRHRGAADLSDLPLERVADVPGVVVDVTASRGPGIGRLALAAHDVTGRAVLLRTGWDLHWRTPAYLGPTAPFLTRDGAQWLVDHGAVLVGIDSVNIDSTQDGERPAHTLLLAAGIPVLEHLTGLGRLPVDGFRLHAAPVPVRAMGTFPVRAYAVVAG
jgi:arylformamidase